MSRLFRIHGAAAIDDRDVECKNMDAERSIEEHVRSGSRGSSQYLSLSKTLEAAMYFAFYGASTILGFRGKTLLVVEPPEGETDTLKDVSTEDGCRVHGVLEQTAMNFAKCANEVVAEFVIPAEWITLRLKMVDVARKLELLDNDVKALGSVAKDGMRGFQEAFRTLCPKAESSLGLTNILV
eukprot:GEMP01033978.1.p1 GENE.GEMP01033978.1~~GEMP01033978.1.p1  ORF type:complete len:182 (+),score=46.80 GEMP01033978.1:92-637(+)